MKNKTAVVLWIRLKDCMEKIPGFWAPAFDVWGVPV